MSKIQIACVSDVQLGYGSPQIIELMKFLCIHYDAQGIVLEPNEQEGKRIVHSFKDLSIVSIKSRDTYSKSGRTQYLKNALKVIESIKPEIFVICTTFCLPILFELSSKPKFVIYYYLETAMVYGQHDTIMNSKIKNLVDLIIFTEENRARRFGEVCGFQKIPFCIVYNSINDVSTNSIIPFNKRNGRIIYQGTIGSRTYAQYYFDDRIQSIPIDLYGNIDKKEKSIYEKKFAQLKRKVHYKGFVKSSELSEIRKPYSFSIINWKPLTENALYASPNKFFESISAGIPTISAPHPQCKLLTNRYKCGLIMPTWDFDDFYDTLELALYLFGTNEYEKMVENCSKAVNQELNWETQMKKIIPLLPNV